MKKPVCMFCGAPATLLCDGIIGWDADEDEHGHMTKCRAMFTCDAPVCRNCVTWHGNIFFDGKIRMMDTRDLCPLCQKLHEAGESIRVAEHRKNSALPQYVTQIKTGMKIAIPLSLTLRATGLRLGTVIDRCRLVSRTDFMISAGIRKNSPTGNIHPDGLTKKFVKARKISGVKFSDNPPTFHEIRSLAGRLYKDERGEEFAQKLLGHTSENTTKLYLDERDNKAYVML